MTKSDGKPFTWTAKKKPWRNNYQRKEWLLHCKEQFSLQSTKCARLDMIIPVTCNNNSTTRLHFHSNQQQILKKKQSPHMWDVRWSTTVKSGSLPSEGSQQRWTSWVESVETAPHGRWMLGICSFMRAAALGELGIHVFERKAWRAPPEAAVGAAVREGGREQKATKALACLQTQFAIFQ